MKKIGFFLLFLMLSPLCAYALPEGFVYLKDIDPSILQDIRYAGYHNFLGHPVAGYENTECILTQKAALQLKAAQEEFRKSNLSIKVYDCYRPQIAVDSFIGWSKNSDNAMKAEFYPNIDKKDVFTLGYVTEKSGHTRGSTVDLTLAPLPTLQQADYHRGQSLVACNAPYHQRYRDNMIDMGTGYDCLDEMAFPSNTLISLVAYNNRMILRSVMMKHDFKPYEKEWWHFTLNDEPFPEQYFNFPVE